MSKTKLRKMKIKTMELKNFSHIHYKSCHSKESMKENCIGKKIYQIQKKTLIELEILYVVLMVNTN